MKKATKHFVNLLLGGVFFLIPILIIIVLISRAFKLLNPISEAIANVLDKSSFLKVFLVEFISLVILLGICYLAGVLLKNGIIKNWKGNIEEKMFFLFPGLLRLKMSLLGNESGIWKEKWQAALIEEDDHYRLGFYTESERSGYYSVFFPDAPRMDAGEVRYYPSASFKYHKISLKELSDSLSDFGRSLPGHCFPPAQDTKNT